MIISLRVRNFALFEHIHLQLEPGMTVFTGETGAGKSILVDALGAIFGARANADWVRHGAEKAEIIADIESSDPRLLQLLDEQDMDADEGISLRRVITAEGRSRAWINGIPVAAGILKRIGNICLDLHGQHEHHTLMQPELQRQMIDARVPSAIKQATQDAYQQLADINQKLKHLREHHSQALQKEAWMREESERLLALEIEEGLEDKLEAECEAGRHIEKVRLAAAAALNLLDGQDMNMRSLLGEAIHHVEAVAEHHGSLREAHDLLAQMDALASEISPCLRDVLDTQIDAASLQQAEDRLANLRAAKRRHNTDEQGLLKLLDEWESTLGVLDTAAWDEEALQARQKEAELEYEKAAQALHQARKKAADSLIKSLRPFLDQLGLKPMRLKVSIVARDDKQTWKEDGRDDIAWLAAANVGEPFKSLADTASGGELSRLVLAFKGCGALEHEPDTAVFDEVDVGIGGETAWCVGELLRRMGGERQVLVVSHLPQVAACAHHQVAIEKTTQDNRTHTTLTLLNHAQRQAEIARMLGGVHDKSLEHARHMLERGATGHA